MKLDIGLITSKMHQINSLVANAKRLEEIYLEGSSPEDIIKKAKETLGMTENELLNVKAEDIVKDINVQNKLMVDLASITERTKGMDSGELKDELDKLLKQTATLLECTVDDLILEE